MKCAQPNYYLFMVSSTTILLALAFASQTAVAAASSSSRSSSSSLSILAARSSTKRSLQEDQDEDDFDFGDWAEELWDNALDSVGLGSEEDDENTTTDESNNEIDWGNPDAWDDWFVGLLQETEEMISELTEFDVCTIIEEGIGIGSGFGAAANCECLGDFGTGLEVDCSFENCWESVSPEFDGTCSTVDLNYSFGGPDGTVDFRACSNTEGLFEEICFSYQLDVKGSDDSIWPTQTCQATYGGQSCSCTIDFGVVLSVDCSSLLPGATFGAVKEDLFSTVDIEDLQHWFPELDMVQRDFQLTGNTVPWETLDLVNLDFENFDITAVEWGGTGTDGAFEFDFDFQGEFEDFVAGLESTWRDLFGDNPTFFDADQELSDGVCTLMAQAVDLSEELGVDGACSCGYDDSTGVLALSCAFSETCVVKDNSLDNSLGIDLPPLCGSVAMNLTYANLAEIYADVCVTYSDFPKTCYSYGIPFAASPFPPGDTDTDTDSGTAGIGPIDYTPPVNINIIDKTLPDLTSPFSRDCSARYGEENNNIINNNSNNINSNSNDCQCTIDANFCVRVDCSAFEPLATTGGDCQVVDLKGATDSSRLVLGFSTPGKDDVVSDGSDGEFVPATTEAQSSSGSRSGRAFETMVVVSTVAALAIATTVLGLCV